MNTRLWYRIRRIMAALSGDGDDLLFRAVLQASPDGVAVLDREGRFLRVNRRGAELLGFDRPDPLIGESAFDYFLPEEVEKVRAEVVEVFAEGTSRTREFTLRRVDGSTMAAEIAVDLIRDAEGHGVALVAITRDISEQAQARAMLAASEQRFRAIFEHASDGIVICRLDRRVIDCNPAMARLLGRSREQVIGLSAVELHPVSARDRVMAFFDGFARGEVMRTDEIPVMGRDGAELEVEISASRIDVDGETFLVGVFRDVTTRRRFEEQVVLARQMEAVGRLAGGVAHDFNNLLAVIQCYAAFIADEVGDRPNAAADLATIRDAAARAERLTNQLLAYSRRQQRRLELVDVGVAVDELGKMLRRVLGEDIALEIRGVPDLWTIEVDRSQLEQILLHLAINARDAMPGGGTLVIATQNVTVDADSQRWSVTSEVPSGSYVELTVCDSGQGMTPEVRDKIFEPFFTTKGTGKGTGLGLAMVYGVVMQSGGYIAIDSAPGRGTTFELLFPRHQPESAPEAEEPPPRDVPARSARILVVEDDSPLREAIGRVLVSGGYQVLSAHDGREALDLCAAAGPTIDLMVTDVVMPRMSGKELADRLTGLCPAMRILFVSGYPNQVLSEHGVIPEDLAFLSKPFTPTELLDKVREILGSR